MLSFRIQRHTLLILPLLASLLACQNDVDEGTHTQFTQGNTPATDNTAKANAQVREGM